MVRWIVGSSQKFRLIVVPVAMVLFVLGTMQLRNLPTDVLPEFSPPTVQIQTEALGLSAVEVEQFITVPMEQDLLNGVPWLDTIRSKSVPGLSQVDLVFQPGTEIIKARQVVGERLTQAVALPHVSKAPTMIDPVSSTSRVMVVGLSSKNVSLIDMSVLARWQIKPRLQGLPGVANVSVWGQRERQLQVQVDPAQLGAQGVSLNQVISTTGNALWVSPLTFLESSTPGTGGFIESNSQRLSIQHVLPITTASDLARVPLEDGQGKRLGDVAKVVEDHQPLIGDGVVADAPGLMLVVEKAPGADTMEVTKEVDDALEALAPGLAGIDVDTTVYRPATYLESGLNNVRLVLLLGLIAVVVLLGVVFFDWRTALVSLVVLPLSVLAAGLVLYLRGSAINFMVMAGLAVAIGVLVDDAVGDIDNLRRRIRERAKAGETVSPVEVFATAIAEVRGPLVVATLIQLVATVPLLLLPGVGGALTRSLALSYGLAVLASLAVALLLTPALALTAFARVPRSDEPSPVLRWLRSGHTRAAARVARWPIAVAIVAAVLVAAAPLALSRLHGSLIPQLQDRNLLVAWTGTPSMSQAETRRIAELAGARLRDLPSIANVGVQVGRAVTSDQVAGVNAGEFWVSIKPDADYADAVKSINEVLGSYPGFDHRIMNYPQQRVTQLQTGTHGDLTVRVFGTEFDGLTAKAQEIRTLLASVPGVSAPVVDQPPMQPTIEIEVNLAAAERYGLKPGDVRRAAAVLLSGVVAGSLFEQQKVFDVVVLGVPTVRDGLTSVQNLQIDTPNGGHVLMKDVADVRIRSGPTVIQHDAVSRRVDVNLNVRGRSISAVAADIRQRLRGVSFPVEYHAEVLNAPAQKASDHREAWAITAGAAIAILLLLQAAFGSWRLAAMLFLALLLAPVGSVFAIALDGPVSIGSLVGLLAVWALALRQSILLVRHWQTGSPAGPETAWRGTADRFAPIVKSTLATAVAVLPTVIAGRIAGLEILHPLAVSILGGLVTSTLLLLFVLPALYARFGAPQDDTTRHGSTQDTAGSAPEESTPDGAELVRARAATAAATVKIPNQTAAPAEQPAS